MNQDLKEIISDVKKIWANSVILYVLPEQGSREGMIYKSIDHNHEKSLTHDLLNLLLQEQFLREFNFSATLELLKSSIGKMRPELFDFEYNLDHCRSLFEDFNHLEQPTDESKVQFANKQLKEMNEKLEKLRADKKLFNYIFYSNIDNQTIYCQDTDKRAILLMELVANICQELHLNPNSLIDAMIEKAKTLRTQLIMGTYNKETQQKSILLKLSQFGYLGFYRGYDETKIQDKMIRVSKFVQNNGSDWHCIFVESPRTNYLSISYTDFAEVKKNILTFCRGDDKPEHIEKNANWLKLAFSAIDLNKWFYPSKQWNSTKNAISKFSHVEGESPLPVDEFVQDNQSQVNGILSEVVKNNMTNVKSAFNKKLKKEYQEPLGSVIFQLLGTLTSVYPEHQDEIKDFGRTIEKELL